MAIDLFGARENWQKWQTEKAAREAAAAEKAAQEQLAREYGPEPLPDVIEFQNEGPLTADVDPFSGMYVSPELDKLPQLPKEMRELPSLAAMDEMGEMAAQAEAARRAPSTPTAFDVGQAAGQGATGAGANGYALAQAGATQGVHRVTTANPMAKPVREFTSTTRAADAATKDAVELGNEREFEHQLNFQRFLGDEQQALAAARTAQWEDEQIRAARASEHLARSNMIQGEVDKAAEAFKSAPEEDQGRFWASRTGFQKFALALSAALKGWLKGSGMDVDPMATIRSAIAEDIEEQRSNRAKLGEQLNARERQAAQARTTYEQLLEKFGDERLVSNMMETARLKEAQARLAVMGAERDTAMMDPQHAQLEADLASEIAKKELERKALEIKTPPTVTRTVKGPNVRVVGPDGRVYTVPRSFAMQQAGKEADQGRALQGKAIDVTADAAKQQVDARTRLDEKAQEAQRLAKKDGAEAKRFIAKETAPARRVRKLAADLLADIEAREGDVPGVGSVHIPLVGALSHEMTAEARDFKRRIEALKEYDITDLTGAVAGDDQKAVIQSFMDGNEDSIVSGLTEIQRAMDSYVNTIESADPEAALEMRGHNPELDLGGWKGARVDTPAGQSRVVEED